MKFLSAVVIVAFIGMAIFSFAGMGGMGHFELGGCLASLLQQTTCPTGNAVAFADFHISAFHSFSTALVVSTAAMLAAIFLIIIFFLNGVWNTEFAFAAIFPTASERKKMDGLTLSKESFSRWLKRLILSPSSKN